MAKCIPVKHPKSFPTNCPATKRFGMIYPELEALDSFFSRYVVQWCCISPPRTKIEPVWIFSRLTLAEEEQFFAEAKWSAVPQILKNAKQLTRNLPCLISGTIPTSAHVMAWRPLWHPCGSSRPPSQQFSCQYGARQTHPLRLFPHKPVDPHTHTHLRAMLYTYHRPCFVF